MFYLNRDLDFQIYLKNADGSAYTLPVGAQYRFRVFGQPGIVVADLAWGAGIVMGGVATDGRLDVTGGTLTGIDETFTASAELIRSNTGADVIAVWPVQIIKEGRVPFLPPGAIAINMGAGGVAINTQSGFGGPGGPPGPPGPSTLVAAVVPFLPNGDFYFWDNGTGPFDGDLVVAPGVRFDKNSSSTHAISRVAGFNANSQGYALRWNRSVAGSGNSFLKFYVGNLQQFHGRQLTLAFEAFSPSVRDFNCRLQLNFGAGGSATVVQNNTAHQAQSGGLTITKAAMAIDLTGKTVTDDSSLEVQIYRTSSHADGNIDLQNMRLWWGATDYGMPPMLHSLNRQMLSRNFEVLKDRSINGERRIYFEKKRIVPVIIASVGSVSQITEDSCLLVHTAAADVTLTIDAEFNS